MLSEWEDRIQIQEMSHFAGGYLEDKVILEPVCITGCCCSVELASTSSTFPEKWSSHYVQDGVPSHVTLIASVYILCDPNQKAGHECSKGSRRASHSLSARFMLQPGTEWSRLTASGTRYFSKNGLAFVHHCKTIMSAPCQDATESDKLNSQVGKGTPPKEVDIIAEYQFNSSQWWMIKKTKQKSSLKNFLERFMNM